MHVEFQYQSYVREFHADLSGCLRADVLEYPGSVILRVIWEPWMAATSPDTQQAQQPILLDALSLDPRTFNDIYPTLKVGVDGSMLMDSVFEVLSFYSGLKVVIVNGRELWRAKSEGSYRGRSR